MASLCGLDPALGVKAVISFNGVYDWVRRNDAATFVETSDMEHNKFVTFLSNEVVQKPWDTADTYSFEQRLEGKKRTGASANSSVLSAHAVSKNAIYYHASPVHLLPFADPKQIPAWFVLKGTHDNLVSLSQYARFVEALKKYGVVNPVAYSSVPYGGHSFEAVPCLKMALVTQAIECFLKTVYAQHYDLAST